MSSENMDIGQKISGAAELQWTDLNATCREGESIDDQLFWNCGSVMNCLICFFLIECNYHVQLLTYFQFGRADGLS